MVKYEEFVLNNFAKGYDSKSSPEALPDNSFTTGSTDVHLTSSGGVEKRKGYEKAITNTAEVHTVTCLADGQDGRDLDDLYWVFYETATNAFYCWFNVDAGGSDPSPTPPGGVSYTAIEVALVSADTAVTVATNTKTAIDASAAKVTTARSGAVLTITNLIGGNVTDVADGSPITGFTFASSTATVNWETATDDGYDETIGVHQYYDPGEIRALVRIARNATTDAIRFEYNALDLPDEEVDAWTLGTTMLVDSATFSGNSEEFCMFARANSATNGPALYVACPGFTGSGSNSPIKYLTYSSGFTVRSMTTSGSTRTLNKPTGIELWYDRIVTFCDPTVESGTFLLWSDINAESFDLGATGDWYKVPGDGPITAIKRLGRRLIVFKNSSMYIASGGEDPTNLFRLDPLHNDVGCIARRSVVEVEGLVYFLSDKGFYVTDGYDVSFVGEPVEPETADLDKTSIDRAFAVHNRALGQIAWFLPFADGAGFGYGLEPYGVEDYGSGTTDQKALVYDYGMKAWCAPYTNQPFLTGCEYTNEVGVTGTDDEIVIVGGEEADDGHIYIWNSTNADDGVTVNASVVTKPFDLDDPAQTKILRKIYVKIADVGVSTPMAIDVFSQYANITQGEVTADSTVTQAPTAAGEANFPYFTQTRHTVGSNGKHFQFRVRDYNDGSTDGGPWILAGITGLFTRKGRRS